jgi:hypothetical protein
MKAALSRSARQEKNMGYLITQAELEHYSDIELRQKLNAILADLARRNMAAADCPLAMLTLRNIQEVLRRKALKL